jgi:hypothetical protein
MAVPTSVLLLLSSKYSTVIFGNDSPLIRRRIGFLATSIHRPLINVLNHLVHDEFSATQRALSPKMFFFSRFIIDKIEWQINLLVLCCVIGAD